MNSSTHQATDIASNPSNDRYNRQVQVSQVGEAGQLKLATAKVAIVGMGGLGCPIAQYLVGAGIGSLTLIDHDVVSESNLHRQILYRESDVGQSKSGTALSRLSDLNSNLKVIASEQRLSAENIDTLLATSDIIVDATDNFAISYLLSDFCLMRKKPLISASVMGVQGYLGVFCWGLNTQIPSLRAVFPNPPQVGQDCNSVGVIGTSAGIIGTLQAQEVIKVILGDSAQLAGRLLSLDLWHHRQTLLDFNNANEPSICARIISQQQINDDDWVIDVRRPEEVQQQAKTLANIDIQHRPMSQFHQDADITACLPTDRRIVLTCQSGQRALSVADSLIEAGMKDVAVWI